MSDEQPTSEPRPRGWRPRTASARSRLDGTANAHPLGSARRRKLAAVLAAICALAGVILGWLFFLQRFHEPFFLTIAITEYTEPGLPVNAWAEEDGALLKAHFPGSRQDLDFQEGHQLREALRTLNQVRQSAAVVHLRAHALERDNQVFVLPGNAQLDDLASTAVPLDEVLQAVQKCPATQRLLILDLMRPIADPALGVLANDVAAHVHGVLERELAKPNLASVFVLCACRSGQVSLVSEELGQSVFAHYLHEGLSGSAENYGPDGKEDNRISVRELTAFVTDHVQAWTRYNRGAEQKPVLLGGGADFDLVTLTRTAPPRPAVPKFTALPDWLLKGWQRRDEWLKDGDSRAAPQGLRRAEAALLRAEERWRGGVEEQRVLEKLGLELEASAELVKQAQVPLAGRSPGSLAAAVAAGKQPDPLLAAEVAALLKTLDQSRAAAKPEEQEKLRLDANTARLSLLKKCKDRAFELGWAVLEQATLDPRWEHVRFLAALLADNQPVSPFAEVEFVRRLGQFLDVLERERRADLKQLRPELLLAALRTTRKAEQAAAGGPRVWPWVRTVFAEAAEQRHQGLEMLWRQRPDQWGQAAARLQQAEAALDRLVQACEQLPGAYALQEQVLLLLPGLPAYLQSLPAGDDRVDRGFTDTVEALVKLEALLASPSLERVGDIADLCLHSRQRLPVLEQPFAAGLKELTAEAAPEERAAAYARLEALLAAPLLTAAQRAQAWSAARKIAGELHQESARPETLRRLVRRAGEDLWGAMTERDRALLRARLFVQQLRAAGLAEADRLAERVKRMPGDLAAVEWSNLAKELRTAWRKGLPAQLRAGPAAARRPLYFLPAGDPALSVKNGGISTLRRQEASEYESWLEKHHADERAFLTRR